jgi:hypothetical protein
MSAYQHRLAARDNSTNPMYRQPKTPRERGRGKFRARAKEQLVILAATERQLKV